MFNIEFARIATEQGVATDVFNINLKSNDEKIEYAKFLKLRRDQFRPTPRKVYHEV